MIKTRITEQPTSRTIIIPCPSCNTGLARLVKLNQRQGQDECFICGTKFEWIEEEDKVEPEQKGGA